VMSRDDTQELAAGLALGTLNADARLRALDLEQRDPELRRAVENIERRLAPLNALLPEIAPLPDAFASIEARIQSAQAALPGTITLRAGS
jgi:anti-sigma-K factor RskA